MSPAVTEISCSSIAACPCPLGDDSRHKKLPLPLCAGVRIGGIRRMQFVAFLQALFTLTLGAGLPAEPDTPVSARTQCCAGDPRDGILSGLWVFAAPCTLRYSTAYLFCIPHLLRSPVSRHPCGASFR